LKKGPRPFMGVTFAPLGTRNLGGGKVVAKGVAREKSKRLRRVFKEPRSFMKDGDGLRRKQRKERKSPKRVFTGRKHPTIRGKELWFKKGGRKKDA